ncbi:MAG: hypothetical protein SFU83_02235 [Meiothermus sp.]|nr:hypothetical protein [Meiothermus sp.]
MHYLIRRFTSSVIFFVLLSFSYAQTTNPPPPSTSTGSLPTRINILSSFEFWLSLIVLFFGLLVITAQFLSLRSLVTPPKPEDILRIFTLSLVTIGTLFIITAGYSATEIAPALGLFGTIAGYLLGKGFKENASSDEEKK